MLNLYANLLGMEQWVIILVVILVLFGGTKIPELMRGIGRGVGELQKGLEDGKKALLHSAEEAKAGTPASTETTTAVPNTTTVPK